jgi:RNA polymerase sigma-70 factor (ECF subfamily)
MSFTSVYGDLTGAQVSPTQSDRPVLLRLGAGWAIVFVPNLVNSPNPAKAREKRSVSANSAGRSADFEAEALPHLDAVYRLALRLAGDEMQAEDLTQETMLKAYRAWHQYKSGTNVRAWLLTILRHTFINQYRKAKRAGPTVDVAEIEAFTVFHNVMEVDPEGSFFNQIVDDEVLRAIDRLPEEFRETLVLSDVEQMSYAEIADITGVPVGTVKSRLFRARQALQKELYDYAVEMGYIKKADE